MKLVERGRIELDSRLAECLPKLKIARGSAASRITVKQLLSHSSGLPVGPPKNPSRTSLSAYVESMGLDRTVFEPGTQMSYSNAGFSILGYLIEKYFDCKYSEAMRVEIVVPMGLSAATTGPEVPCGEWATGYVRSSDGSNFPADLYARAHEYSAPSGSMMWASASDLVRFSLALLSSGEENSGALLAEASSVAAMRRRISWAPDNSIGDWWGLGLTVFNWEGGALYGHVGRAPGFTSYLLCEPQTRVSCALLMNEESDAALEVYRECLGDLFRHLADVQIPERATQAEMRQVESLRAYCGVYVGSEFRIRIGIHAGQLCAWLSHVSCAEEPGDPWASIRSDSPGSLLFMTQPEGHPVSGRVYQAAGDDWIHLFAQAHRRVVAP